MDCLAGIGAQVLFLRFRNPFSGITCMQDRHSLTLRHADQARTDFALIEGHLEFIAGQLAKVPTRGELARASLGMIFCTAVLMTLLVWLAWY